MAVTIWTTNRTPTVVAIPVLLVDVGFCLRNIRAVVVLRVVIACPFDGWEVPEKPY